MVAAYANRALRRYAQRMEYHRALVMNRIRERARQWPGGALVWIVMWVGVCCMATAAYAQQGAPLQDTSGGTNGDIHAIGMISGTVTDSDGALVEGAQVALTGDAIKGERRTVTDSEGRFQFAGVGAGTFRLTVTSRGLASSTVSGTLHPDEIYEEPAISLQVEATHTEVNVSSLTQQEIAVEEVHAEEQQRVVGVVPNYFVTYEKNPVPLRAKQKFGLGWHVVVDPTNFLFAGVTAGIEQADNTFPGYGGGPQGFGKRYGAALANSTSSTLLRGSVYPSLFHQDPRYFYKGTGTVWQRTKYALATAVICKGDNGRWEPNYSGILGDLSAGALANTYYPAGSRNGAALTFEDGLLSTAGVGVGHLLQEFLYRRISTHVPHAGAPQP